MHMADALLSPAVSGAMYAASAASIACAVHKIDMDEVGQKKLPLMAVSGAFVFAAQMINFTIPATGSSGHIGGGILLAGLLGGFPALLTLAAVLVIQCLFFADGGLLALGANIFNMGVLPCLVAYPLLFRPLLRKGVTRAGLTLAAVLSTVVGLQLGALGVVLETLASGVTELPFGAFIALMQPIHLAIGVVEGLITAAILNFVYQMRPEILHSTLAGADAPSDVGAKQVAVLFAVLAVLVGGGLSFAASSNPDGLEWSIEHIVGTAELEEDGAMHNAAAAVQEQTAILPDYDYAAGDGTGTGTAGVIGALLTCALAGGTGAAISIYKRHHAAKTGDNKQ